MIVFPRDSLHFFAMQMQMHFSLQPPSHLIKNLELLLHLALQSIAQLNSTQLNLI